MDLNGKTHLDSAKAILGEFCKNYVIITQSDEDPESFELTFSEPYATKALLEQALTHHSAYLNGGTNLWEEWVWEEEDEQDY